MKKKIFILLVIVIITLVSVPLFAGVSLDLGVTVFGNAVYQVSRPLGAAAAVGITLFNAKALLQVTGGILSPPLGDAYTDPALSFSAGLLFSPVEYLYLGLRTGMITPPDEIDDWASYGSMVIRVQKPGKGIHYFAETEISLTGLFNRFSMGINLTL